MQQGAKGTSGYLRVRGSVRVLSIAFAVLAAAASALAGCDAESSAGANTEKDGGTTVADVPLLADGGTDWGAWVLDDPARQAECDVAALRHDYFFAYYAGEYALAPLPGPAPDPCLAHTGAGGTLIIEPGPQPSVTVALHDGPTHTYWWDGSEDRVCAVSSLGPGLVLAGPDGGARIVAWGQGQSLYAAFVTADGLDCPMQPGPKEP